MKNFEHYTEKLSQKEKDIYVPWFVAGLSKKIGAGAVITNPQMIEGIQKKYGVRLSEPQVRKIIAFIRKNDLLPGLIATQKGYYIATELQEIKDYIQSLEEREKGLREARLHMERYLVAVAAKIQQVKGN